MNRNKIFWLVIVGLYLLTRLWQLTLLPVFADEAIYIRWAQLISTEPIKYLFLPLYDGKTPLVMWVNGLMFFLFKIDPLWIARLSSVLFGLGTLILVKKMWGSFAGWVYVWLPFTFFHDRVALTDTALLFCLSLTWFALIKLTNTPTKKWLIITGVGFGLSLLAKIPALFFIPVLYLYILLIHSNIEDTAKKITYVSISIIIGLSILYSMRLSVFWPFLFQRSGDFSFTVIQLMQGSVGHIIPNFLKYISYSYNYLGLFFVMLVFIGFLDKKVLKYFLLVLIFITSFILLGKIVFSRYYLPEVLLLIPLSVAGWNKIYKFNKWVGGLVVGLLMINGIWFMWPFWTNCFNIRLPLDDQKQYLTEWSAGFGIKETADYLIAQSIDKSLVVATEGYFGTLPDGIYINLHNSNAARKGLIEVIGIGQPIGGIKKEVWEKARGKEAYLVVNENRLRIPVSQIGQLVKTFPKPYGGSPLLLIRLNNNE